MKTKRQTYCFFLAAVLAILLFGNWAGRQPVTSGSSTASKVESQQRGNIESVVSITDGRHADAMITDARSLQQIGNTRPQRVIPSLGSKPGKNTGRFPLLRRLLFHSKNAFFNRRIRLETAPFRAAASCDYYIIALRRIIR